MGMNVEKRQDARAAPDSPFAVRGAIEGFYGTFYTHPQRKDLIRFMGRHGFNTYVYGPKNDRHHRSVWREPYPATQMAQFADTVEVAKGAGVQFVYALSPGQDIVYSSEADFARLTDKLQRFYDVGVRAFSLFLDDIPPQFSDDVDSRHYANFATAQADLCNRTLHWLQDLDEGCSLSMCPTDYHGAPPFSESLHTLGTQLAPEIDVFYTGPKICSPRITTADVQAFAGAVRRPPLIWDNYPVNDLAMRPEMHIGPVRGRSGSLHENVRGVLANLMLQPEASKIPLRTFAAYFQDPAGYEPEAAWEAAIREVAGTQADAVRRLGENSLGGCLRMPEAERLTALAQEALAAMEARAAKGDVRLQALESYLLQLDEACYAINYTMENLALRQELLLWTEALQRKQAMGRQALAVWRAEPGPTARQMERLEELIEEVRADRTRIGGEALMSVACHVAGFMCHVDRNAGDARL